MLLHPFLQKQLDIRAVMGDMPIRIGFHKIGHQQKPATAGIGKLAAAKRIACMKASGEIRSFGGNVTAARGPVAQCSEYRTAENGSEKGC